MARFDLRLERYEGHVGSVVRHEKFVVREGYAESSADEPAVVPLYIWKSTPAKLLLEVSELA